MNEKVVAIKQAIKSKTYDWTTAIIHTADRIIEYPQALLWH